MKGRSLFSGRGVGIIIIIFWGGGGGVGGGISIFKKLKFGEGHPSVGDGAILFIL